MNFIDSHAHINDPAFDTVCHAQIIQKSFDAGLSRAIVEIGCEEQNGSPPWDAAKNTRGKYIPYAVCTRYTQELLPPKMP